MYVSIIEIQMPKVFLLEKNLDVSVIEDVHKAPADKVLFVKSCRRVNLSDNRFPVLRFPHGSSLQKNAE